MGFSDQDLTYFAYLVLGIGHLLISFLLAKWLVKEENKECWEETGDYANSLALSILFGLMMVCWPLLLSYEIVKKFLRWRRKRMIEIVE